jgi:hypothetical protein
LKRIVGKIPSDKRLSVEELKVPPIHQDQTFHTTRTANAYKSIKKLPLPLTLSDEPESVPSTPHRAWDARSTKIKQFVSPIRVRRLPLGGGKHKPVRRDLEKEEGRSRAMRTCRVDQPIVEHLFITLAKEQKGGTSGSRKRLGASEVEDDPDLRIAAVNALLQHYMERECLTFSFSDSW